MSLLICANPSGTMSAEFMFASVPDSYFIGASTQIPVLFVGIATAVIITASYYLLMPLS